MQTYKESENRRKERIHSISSLRTRVIESKKSYNRNKIKDSIRKQNKDYVKT